MGEKRGRKNKYEEYVKPNLSQIEAWAKAGATEKEICTALGIALSTFYEYKKQYSELSRALRAGRQSVVLDIKAALLKKALGFNYEEKKQYIKQSVETGEKVQYTEIMTRHCVPSETAAAMLLRNYDGEWADRDKTSNDLRRQELELREAIAKCQNFDIEL